MLRIKNREYNAECHITKITSKLEFSRLKFSEFQKLSFFIEQAKLDPICFISKINYTKIDQYLLEKLKILKILLNSIFDVSKNLESIISGLISKVCNILSTKKITISQSSNFSENKKIKNITLQIIEILQLLFYNFKISIFGICLSETISQIISITHFQKSQKLSLNLARLFFDIIPTSLFRVYHFDFGFLTLIIFKSIQRISEQLELENQDKIIQKLTPLILYFGHFLKKTNNFYHLNDFCRTILKLLKLNDFLIIKKTISIIEKSIEIHGNQILVEMAIIVDKNSLFEIILQNLKKSEFKIKLKLLNLALKFEIQMACFFPTQENLFVFLTETIENIINTDNIEKMSPKIQNIFLKIFEENPNFSKVLIFETNIYNFLIQSIEKNKIGHIFTFLNLLRIAFSVQNYEEYFLPDLQILRPVLDLLEELQFHPNQEIYRISLSILNNNFAGELEFP